MRPPKLSRQTRSPSLLGPSSASGGGVAWLHVRRIAEATGNPKRPGRGEGRGTTLERRRASSCSVTSGDGLRAPFACHIRMRQWDAARRQGRFTVSYYRRGATRWPARSTHHDVHVWRYLALVQFDRSDRTSHMSENDENCSRCKHPMSQHEIESDASENDDSEHETRGACEVRTCFCPRFSPP